MPTGLNLTVNFDTQADQHPEDTYPFITGGTGPAAPIDLGTVDAYHGMANDGLKFFLYTNIGFSLCEYETSAVQYNIIDLDYPCPEGIIFTGAAMEVSLETVDLNNLNLNLCYQPEQYGSYTSIELGELCGLINLSNDIQVDFDLFTRPVRAETNLNLALCCDYETPDRLNTVFYLGATEIRYLIETEGDTPYDFVFDSQSRLVQTTNYLLDVGGTPDSDFFSPCNLIDIVAATCADADLTTDPANPLVNDFSLCPESPQTRPIFEGLTELVEPDSEDTNLEPGFSHGSHYWIFEYTPKYCNPAMRGLAIHDTDMGVELEVEKNFEIDFPLCGEDTNPPADYSENPNHIFEFKVDYIYECGAFEFVCYHGHNNYVTTVESVEFDEFFAFGGAFSDASLSPFQNFQADAYNGAVNSYDLTIFPSIELTLDHYAGHYGDADFFTVVVFQNVDGYHGAYGDLDFSTFGPPTFEPNAYHGGDGEFEMLTEPNIQETDAYHGAYGDLDFTSFPAAQLEPNAYHGGAGTVDTIILTPQFEPVAYHGLYSDLDFTDVPSAGVGDVDAYHGGTGETTMAVTLGLREIDGYHGAVVEANQLSFATTFDVDHYNGGYGDADFTETPPPTFDMDAYHGGNGVQDDMSVTRALFPRAYAGASADAGLSDFPAQELDITAYSGHNAVVDQIENDPWNFFCYHGSNTEALLGIQINFGETDAYHGASTDWELNYEFVSLDIDSYHGIRSIITAVGFDVPEPPSMAPEAYHGAAYEFTTDIREHAKLKVRFVHDLAMYDGFGGIGGLNHCYTTDLTYSSHYTPNDIDGPDHVIRFEYPLDGNLENYDSDLDIIFDEYGDRPYNVCNSHHNNGHMSIDLSTAPRFDAEAYAGEGTAIFMKKELTAFGEVPDDVLYSEDGEGGRRDHEDRTFTRDFFEFEFNHGAVGTTWWEDDPDSVRAWAGYTCEVEFTLIETSYDVAHGSDILVELGVPKPSWHEFIRAAQFGSGIIMDFEPEIWFRFCPGYIIPIGNNVILEFSSQDNTDCEAWYATGGARADAQLSCSYGLSATCYQGSYAKATVDLQKLWTLYARHGQAMTQASNADFSATFRDGSYVVGEFYEPPIYGAHGAHAEVDGLIVAGPAVEWITPEGCLSNEYVPLTDDGDIDFPALEPDENGVVVYVDVPVEGWPYFTPLNATCITFAESEEGEEE